MKKKLYTYIYISSTILSKHHLSNNVSSSRSNNSLFTQHETCFFFHNKNLHLTHYATVFEILYCKSISSHGNENVFFVLF